LPAHFLDGKTGNLREMIDENLKDEVFEGENLYFCENCQKKVERATKSQTIKHLPEYLIVTVNRFYFDRNTKQKEKICKSVEIPTTLTFTIDEPNEYKI
jgi:ubiquitin C-terminal hydrolase